MKQLIAVERSMSSNLQHASRIRHLRALWSTLHTTARSSPVKPPPVAEPEPEPVVEGQSVSLVFVKTCSTDSSADARIGCDQAVEQLVCTQLSAWWPSSGIVGSLISAPADPADLSTVVPGSCPIR